MSMLAFQLGVTAGARRAAASLPASAGRWSTTDFLPASGAWTISSDGKTASENTGSNASIRTGAGKSTGKWYFEIVGSTDTGQELLINSYYALMQSDVSVGNVQLVSPFTLRSTGNQVGLSTGIGIASGDNISVAVDIDTGKVWFRKNGGTWIGGGDPAAGTTPSNTTAFPSGKTWHPTAGSDNNGANHTFVLKAVTGDLTYTAPSGFSPIGS